MKELKNNAKIEVFGTTFNGVKDMIEHARKGMPKDGVYVGEDSEYYPCFDSFDSLYEDRRYTNLVFATSKEELDANMAILKDLCPQRCNYDKVTNKLHPMIYWEGDAKDDIIMTTSDEEDDSHDEKGQEDNCENENSLINMALSMFDLKLKQLNSIDLFDKITPFHQEQYLVPPKMSDDKEKQWESRLFAVKECSLQHTTPDTSDIVKLFSLDYLYLITSICYEALYVCISRSIPEVVFYDKNNVPNSFFCDTQKWEIRKGINDMYIEELEKSTKKVTNNSNISATNTEELDKAKVIGGICKEALSITSFLRTMIFRK